MEAKLLDCFNTDPSHNALFSLAGQVVVVTGAAGLLGRQHVEAIACAGGVPVLLDIHAEANTKLAAEIGNRFHVPASSWRVDITNEASVAESCKLILGRYGHIDGLVNNAANNPKVEDNQLLAASRLENFSLDVWNADLAVGLTGAFLCAKYYGVAIASNERGGSIVNISSDLGIIAPDQRLYRKHGLPEHLQPVKPVTYSVIKTALIGLTRYLATYWATQGVRCNALCPGGVENGQPADFLDNVTNRIPLGRLASPGDYRGLIVFLLSDSSKYMTGSIVVADGGRSCW